MGGRSLNILKIALLGATFLVGAVGVASAADIYNKGGSLKDEPVYVAPTVWAGFYAGIHAGASFDDELDFSAPGLPDVTDEVDGSFVGGIHVGYNWQASPNLVLGIEGSLSSLNDEDEDGLEVSDYLATIRGRLGYATGGNLFYATAGVAFLGWADDVAEFLEDDTTVGFVAGLGFERKLTSNLSFGVEGLYYNFSDEFETDNMSGPVTADIDRDFWTIQARLNYHFTSGRDDPLK